MEISGELKAELEGIERLAWEGQTTKALCQIDELIKIHPDTMEVNYTRLRIIAEFWNPHDALKAAKIFCRRFPAEAIGHSMVAWIYLNNKNAKMALRHIQIAEDLEGSNEDTRNLKANALYALGRIEEAKRLVELNSMLPSPSLMSIKMSNTLLSEGTEENMLAAASKLRETGETKPNVAIYKADWYKKYGALEKAESVLIQVMEEYPHDYSLVENLADVEYALGKITNAVERMKEAFERDPACSPIAVWLVRYYRQQRKFLSAIRISLRYTKAQIHVDPSK